MTCGHKDFVSVPRLYANHTCDEHWIENAVYNEKKGLSQIEFTYTSSVLFFLVTKYNLVQQVGGKSG